MLYDYRNQKRIEKKQKMKKALLVFSIIILFTLSACSGSFNPTNILTPDVSTTTSKTDTNQLTDIDFAYKKSTTQQEFPIEFGYYYGFTQNQSVVFKLSTSYSKQRTDGTFTLPRNLTLQSTIEDYINAYGIHAQNSVIQVWKTNMSHFYKFDIEAIDELTKGAQWADIVIA